MHASRAQRYILAVILGMLFVLPDSSFGQTAQVKYWIFLDGKTSATRSGKTIDTAEVTSKALERRRARATATRTDALDRNVSPDYLNSLESHGAVIVNQSRWLNAATAYLNDEARQRIENLPFVKEVRPVGTAMKLSTRPEPLALEVPVTPISRKLRLDYGASSTQLEIVNAIAPLERGINGSGVTVGILDTEFGDFSHPAFSNMVSDGRLLGYQNLTDGSQASRHGLYVASIMIGFAEGDLIGPAYGADVLAATTEYSPTETNQEEDDWVAGLEWLESQGAEVVNSSLGYNEFDPGQNSYDISDLDGNTAVTTIAADIAVSLGVVVVNSAGNEGCNSPAQCWYYIITPADGDSVIAVGGVNPSGVKEGFSSWGPTADGRTKPDVSAMGSSVRFAVPTSGYAAGGGTSFAAPMVSGIVAQMLQVNPLLTPMEVMQILRSTASQSASPDNALGWGVVDADAAILQAQASSVDTPGELRRQTTIEVYPNPVTSAVNFVIDNPETAEPAALKVYNLLGKHVATVWEGVATPSESFSWTPSNLPDGIYVYRFSSQTETVSGSLVLIQ